MEINRAIPAANLTRKVGIPMPFSHPSLRPRQWPAQGCAVMQ